MGDDRIKPNDPRHGAMSEISPDKKWLTVYWGGYSYEIELARMKNPADLLWWIHHLGSKSWPHTTPARISRLIEKVSNAKGWEMYS